MLDSTWFLAFRMSVQALMPFFSEKKRVSLNSSLIVGTDGRATGQFYNIIKVSLKEQQSSKFRNKFNEMYFHKHVDPVSFCRTSVAFFHSFSTIIFLLVCFLLD